MNRETPPNKAILLAITEDARRRVALRRAIRAQRPTITVSVDLRDMNEQGLRNLAGLLHVDVSTDTRGGQS